MKVSIRHGHGIPRNDDIKIPYGFGWDESDRKFGEGNGGKTLYIKDPSTNKPIEITAGLLKKEFLNYVFPISTNEDGTAESAVIDFQNGTTFYRKSNNNKFFGLTAGLVSKVEPIVDENGIRMGERVYIDHTSIDTRSNEYKLSAEGEAEDTVKTIVLDSIDPKYIANLKVYHLPKTEGRIRTHHIYSVTKSSAPTSFSCKSGFSWHKTQSANWRSVKISILTSPVGGRYILILF